MYFLDVLGIDILLRSITSTLYIVLHRFICPMDSDMMWDILRFSNWESRTVGFSWLGLAKADCPWLSIWEFQNTPNHFRIHLLTLWVRLIAISMVFLSSYWLSFFSTPLLSEGSSEWLFHAWFRSETRTLLPLPAGVNWPLLLQQMSIACVYVKSHY